MKRLVNALCWLGIFLAGSGMVSILAATRVHGQIIQAPFIGLPAHEEFVPVCAELHDTYDVHNGLITNKSVWMEKMSEGKCAIVRLPWHYSRTLSHYGDFYIAEVRVKIGEWKTLYAVFHSPLPLVVEA